MNVAWVTICCQHIRWLFTKIGQKKTNVNTSLISFCFSSRFASDDYFFFSLFMFLSKILFKMYSNFLVVRGLLNSFIGAMSMLKLKLKPQKAKPRCYHCVIFSFFPI